MQSAPNMTEEKRLKTTITLTVLMTMMILPLAVLAAPRDDLLAQYAAAAKVASPPFSGFSAARGEKLHVT